MEPAVKWFFDQELAAYGLRCMGGYRRGEQLDVVVTFDERSPLDVSIQVQAQQRVEEAHVALHMEIMYRRSSADYGRAMNAVDKLDGSIRQSRDQGVGLPWTALVLSGGGWASKGEGLMQKVHEGYHHTPRSTIRLDDKNWWPFPDAFVLPGVYYKKHDLFVHEHEAAEPARDGKSCLPCYAPTPSACDVPFRPLAMARGFLLHRVRVLTNAPRPPRGSWPLEDCSAIVGPVPVLPLEEMCSFLLHDLQRDVIWHSGSEPTTGERKPIPLAVQDTFCSERGSYVVSPRRT